MELLSNVSVINKDNQKKFTVTDRLEVITNLLWDTKYRRINADGLFHLYAKQPLVELKKKDVFVVSTHVDCERNITKCFSEDIGDGMLRGTYDNSLTNTSILSLLLSDSLPDNVLVAFTGDEEETSEGANHLIAFLRYHHLNVKQIFVLDVTDMGWNEMADFTVENDFWSDDCFGRRIITTAEILPYCWRFVPSDPNDVPEYVSSKNTIYEEAAEDESWNYDEEGFDCCSICIPIQGNMHSNHGVLARKTSMYHYIEFLNELLNL